MKSLSYLICTMCIVLIAEGLLLAQDVPDRSRGASQEPENPTIPEATARVAKKETEVGEGKSTSEESSEVSVESSEDEPRLEANNTTDQARGMETGLSDYPVDVSGDDTNFWQDMDDDEEDVPTASVPTYSGPRTPESPVFVILDLAATDIQKPSAVRPLSISVAKPFTDTEGAAIPLNLSVELSPYWVDSHPTIDWKKYSDSGLEQLYQNLSLSIGTSTTYLADSYPIFNDAFSETHFAFGIRTGIDSRSYSCNQLQTLYKEYRNAVSAAKLQAMDRAVAEGQQLDSFEPIEQEFKKKWLMDREKAESLRKATALCTRKRGWALDAAFAAAFMAPDQVLQDTELTAFSGWLAFGILGDTLSVTPMSRIRSDQLERNDSSTVFDVGGQILLAAKMLAISAEFVYRQVLDKSAEREADGYYRTGLGIDAALSSDIGLTIGVGKDYADLNQANLYVDTVLRFDLGERSLGIEPEETESEYR